MRPTNEIESSLLRTPVGSEAEGGAIHPDDAAAEKRTLKLGWQILAHFGHLQSKIAEEKVINLPTPMVSDAYNDNLVSTQHVDGTMHSVSLAQLMQRQDLFPTPITRDYKDGQAPRIRNGVLQTDSVPLAVMQLERGSWGKFEPAIRRWEKIIGREVPPPTMGDGKNGKHRLSARFAEWMMGLPDGWVTNAGLTRTEALKCCGNGVVPQQAFLALELLIGDRKEEILYG